jgi:formamidopyrimidine-DNA glycosylase
MPEMPEVEVVRRGLAAHAVGLPIADVAVLHPRAVRRQTGGPAQFAALIRGRTLTGTGRRGKFLWLTTDDQSVALAAHLGMSGQFRIDPATVPAGDQGVPDPSRAVPAAADVLAPARAPSDAGHHAHARVRLDLGGRVLWFVDQRTFGWVLAADVVADPRGVPVPEPVRGIACDPADAAFDADAVARAMRTHRVEVKRLLLDQTLVSGIGNIYADEALWRAGVHPRRRADRMGTRALAGVLQAARAVMAESLSAGGTSFDGLYVNVNGQSGYYSRGLSVYGRAGLACPRCGSTVVRERFMNRSSHLCPRCQRPPRAPH